MPPTTSKAKDPKEAAKAATKAKDEKKDSKLSSSKTSIASDKAAKDKTSPSDGKTASKTVSKAAPNKTPRSGDAEDSPSGAKKKSVLDSAVVDLEDELQAARGVAHVEEPLELAALQRRDARLCPRRRVHAPVRGEDRQRHDLLLEAVARAAPEGAGDLGDAERFVALAAERAVARGKIPRARKPVGEEDHVAHWARVPARIRRLVVGVAGGILRDARAPERLHYVPV